MRRKASISMVCVTAMLLALVAAGPLTYAAPSGAPGGEPGVAPGGHGGSHGQLSNEFVLSIIEDRTPLVNIAQALNMTVCGIVASQSALRDGERLEVPQYEMF